MSQADDMARIYFFLLSELQDHQITGYIPYIYMYRRKNWEELGLNPGPLALQAATLTTKLRIKPRYRVKYF